jgi:cellobiose phosphorylase
MIKKVFFFASFMLFTLPAIAQQKQLAAKILADQRLDTIQARALRLLTGFTAGTSYGEVWIRDFNTFINGSLAVHDKEKVKEMLLLFFRMQGRDGNIADGMIPRQKAEAGYDYIYSDLAPEWAAHKNTVETDQESSLVQAVYKYVKHTGDTSILHIVIDHQTVLQRLAAALQYVHNARWSSQYNLVSGATTIDWGDVQPEKGWGVVINDHTKWSADIYDNAMYALALKEYAELSGDTATYLPRYTELKNNVRKYLWQADKGKYLPHLYLDGSPFSPGFKEDEILYTGGSVCAILAGFHSAREIKSINRQMLAAAAKEKYATIGITVYPPYPEQEFPNMKPYVYQNAGDWTWFGGRMIQALTEQGMVKEAYEELSPMLDRALSHQGFYEWYDVQTGAPKGSGDFRGEAGVLYDAITLLKEWARKQK